MIVSALALAAHWAMMSPPNKGVSFGKGRDEYLVLHLPEGDCRRMIVHKPPHMASFYSDVDKARRFLWRSKLCAQKS